MTGLTQGEKVKPFGLFMLVLSGGGAADIDRSRTPPECRALDTPKQLPPVAALIDSAALEIQLVRGGLPESPEIQLGIAFPQPSGAPQAWVIDSGATPDARTNLARLVQDALRADGAPSGTTLRILLRVTAPLQVQIRRSMLCDPVPLDSARSTQPAVRVTDGVRPVPPQSWNAVIRQRIGADGVVLDARLQPGSGQPAMDRLALRPVFARRWRPATLDGRPVEVWFAKDRAVLARGNP